MLIIETKTRESSFELLRIIAQFMIVLYHIYLFFVYPTTNADIDKAIWMPLHIGVPLFVLISGYFGIKVSGKGIFRLIGQMFVYTVPLVLLFNMLISVSGGVNRCMMLFSSYPEPHIGLCEHTCAYICSLQY